jgi:hypothetical protein
MVALFLATVGDFLEEGSYVFLIRRHRNELDAAVKEIGIKSPLFKAT